MKFHFRIVFLFFLLFLRYFSDDLFCQNVKDLDKRKQDNIQQLNNSKYLLEKTAKSKTVSLNQLTLIQSSIALRQSIIENIAEELSFLRNDITSNNLEIERIKSSISTIKKDYGRLIEAASRNLDEDYALMYIFSSADLNQAYLRVKYLRYLTKYRLEMVNRLLLEQENLKNKNLELSENKSKNEQLLSERKKELASLDKDKKQNIFLIHSLQNKEKELKSEIQKRERIQTEIEKEIRRIIEEEVARAKRAKKSSMLTPEEILISSDFSNNMGRLPWPAEKGIVTGKYGEQNHPVLKGIKIKSNGIDINTDDNANVRSVFDGEVTKVIAILGANYTVIIKHGDYRTVYQNLVDVQVRAGDKVRTKSVIGKVFTDQDNVAKLHFEVWKDKQTMNPENWLTK